MGSSHMIHAMIKYLLYLDSHNFTNHSLETLILLLIHILIAINHNNV